MRPLTALSGSLEASPEPRFLLSDWVDQDMCFPLGGRLELWPTDCGRDLVEKLRVLVVEVDRLLRDLLKRQVEQGRVYISCRVS